MAVLLTAINSGIHDTFETNFVMPTSLAAELVDVFWQDYDDLTEGVINTPTVQFYWNGLDTVSEGSTTDRHTFGDNSKTPVRIKNFEFRIDLLLDKKSFVHKIFTHMLPLVDAINDVLEAENQQPYFGVEGIKAFTWECVRGDIEYGDYTYPAVQWTINITVF